MPITTLCRLRLHTKTSTSGTLQAHSYSIQRVQRTAPPPLVCESSHPSGYTLLLLLPLLVG
eukprot:7000087-Prymnesium_polylepis.1